MRADTPEEVPGALEALDSAVAAGRWVAVVLAYELGYVLEPKLRALLPAERPAPLIWAGVYERAQTGEQEPPAPVTPPAGFKAGVDARAYRAGVSDILELIRAGDVYQVNYTYPLHTRWQGDAEELYQALLTHQPVPYPAFIDMGDTAVLSLSPELFVAIEDNQILARPMKGTAPRGRLPETDAEAKARLVSSEKDRAENLMIVDLLRNDLSRIAVPGSVRVSDLFTAETYRTLHTLTSGVHARLADDWTPSQLLKAIFPCGSVTGAPKIRAMEIIRSLEPSPRGVYTGAIGLFEPGGKATLNVAIRTLTLSREGHLTLNVGGGIVADSDAEAEAAETDLKAQFVTALPAHAADQGPLQLIETFAWTPGGGFAYLSEHLARLRRSAAYFAIPFREPTIKDVLNHAASEFGAKSMRVRLTLAEDGTAALTHAPLGEPPTLWHYAMADERIASSDPFRAHKTNRRAIYETARAQIKGSGIDELLFLNERGELAEGTITNLFIQSDEGAPLLTPPVSCGALPGVLRDALIAQGRARECTLFLSDLRQAQRVFFGNSVRGLIPARPATDDIFTKAAR